MAIGETRLRELALELAKQMARADDVPCPLVPVGFREEVLAAFSGMPQWCRPLDRAGAKNHQRILRLRWSMWLDDQCHCQGKCDCEPLYAAPRFDEVAEAIYAQNEHVWPAGRPGLRLVTVDGARVQA